MAYPSPLAVGTTDISVDDVSFDNCHPDFVPANYNQLSCDFETDLCGWFQEQDNDDFDWRVNHGTSSNVIITGPCKY